MKTFIHPKTSAMKRFTSFTKNLLKITVIFLALFSLKSVSAQGPVIISGLDTEYGIRPVDTSHGTIATWAGVIQTGILNNVSLNPTGPILVIGGGKDLSGGASPDEMTSFWNQIGASLGRSIVYSNSLIGDILTVDIVGGGWSMISVCNTADGLGRLTLAELNDISSRQSEIALFVNNGGGLFASSCTIGAPPYGYINVGSPSLNSVSGVCSPSTPTTEGTAMGIPSIGGPFHNSFTQFPSFLNVLSTCGGNDVILGGSEVTIPVDCPPNPDAVLDCDTFRIALVLDESGSIFSAGNDPFVRNATNTLINALNSGSGAGVQMSVIEFGSAANFANINGPPGTIPSPAYSAVDNVFATGVNSYLFNGGAGLDGYTAPGSNTNWEDALNRVIELTNTTTIAPDMVIFLTDGNPSAQNNSTSGLSNLEAAIDESCTIKNNGSHIYIVGVGSNVNTANIVQISGPEANDGIPPGGAGNTNNATTADYVNNVSFNLLQQCFMDLGMLIAGAQPITCPTDVVQEGCSTDDINSTLPYSETEVDITTVQFGNLPGAVITDMMSTVTYIDVSSGNCPTIVTRTFTATDECDNISTCDQIFTIDDTTIPTLSCPSDNGGAIDLGCNPIETGGIPNAIPTTVGFMDNCDMDGLTGVYVDSDVVLTGCDRMLTRTFSHTDACDNTGTCSVTYNWIYDVMDPTIVCPPDTIVECYINKDELEPATAYDNCTPDDEIVITYQIMEEDVDECGLGLYKCLATATDCSGNASTSFNFITVIDTIAPVITVMDATFDCEVGVIPPATATDNCLFATIDLLTVPLDPIVPVITNTVTDLDSCGLGTIVNTWTATDCAGNSSSVDQTITIQDLIAPVIMCPANITFECEIDEDLAGVATAADNCTEDDDIVITYSDNTDGLTCVLDDGTTAGLGDVIRTWTATDCAGNSSTCIQTITLVDTMDPAISCPDEITVECDVDLTDFTILGYPTGWDLCTPMDSLTYTYVDLTADLDSCGLGTIWRQWTVTDCAGNSSTGEQIIHIEDTQAPTLICPADITFECEIDEDLAGVATGMDNCDDDLVITFTDAPTLDMCGNGIILRTWTTQDCAGNVAVPCVQTITIQDTMPPVLDPINPAVIHVQCIDDVPVGMQLPFVDNCDGPGLADFVEVSDMNTCPETITRTWTATDCTGLVATATQTIIVNDTIDPVFTFVPANDSIQCGDPVPAINATATDNCVMPIIVTYDDMVVGDECLMTITRTFTATDDCNNTTTATQIIIIEDTMPPTFDGPLPDAEISAPCDSIPDHTTCTATDNCDTDVEVVYGEEMFSGACAGTIVRTWTATDNCNNSIVFEQTVNLTDDVPPTIVGLPVNQIIQCDEMPSTPPMVTAEDNCDPEPTLTFTADTLAGSCPQESVITWTWVAVDHCMNTTTEIRTITIIDNVAPVWGADCHDPVVYDTENYDVCPADATISLSINDEISINDSWTVGGITIPGLTSCVTDNCSAPEDLIIRVVDIVTTNDSGIENAVCTRTIELTLEAIDECTNVSELLLCSYTFIDNTKPTFENFPADTSVECLEDAATLPQPNGQDNCTGTTINFVDDLKGDDCSGTISRTYTVIDYCGNELSQDQTITISDIIDPVISCQPDKSQECDEALVWDAPTATDNCGMPTVTVISTVSNLDKCDLGTWTRTWQAEDCAGNTSTCSQVITVFDDTDPVWGPLPDVEITAACDNILDPGAVTATDNCDDDVTIEYSEDINSGGCANVIERTWTATDCAGNSIEFMQFVTLTDDVDPVITCPDGAALDCNPDASEYAPGMATATDNCAITVDPTVEVGTPVLINGCTWSVTHIYTATDDCGNTATCDQVFTWTVDNDAPTADACPTGGNIGCNPLEVEYAVGSTTWSDNCGIVDSGVNAGTPSATATGCGWSVTHVYWAIDACDNMGECTQTFNWIVDNDAPTPLSCPLGDDLGCNPLPSEYETGTASWSDDCGVVDSGVNAGTPTPDPIGCGWSVTHVYWATDGCDVTAECTQTYTWTVDNDAPTADACPADSDLGCNPMESEYAPGTASWSDNCGVIDSGVNEGTPIADATGCGWSVTHMYWAVDACDNMGECSQTISWTMDNDAPTAVDCPDIVDIGCNPDSPSEYEPTSVTWSDDCGVVDSGITVGTPTADPTGCGWSVTHTHWAIDACDNMGECAEIITWTVDITPPVFTNVPTDLMVECESDLSDPSLVTGNGYCDMDIPIIYTESRSEFRW